MLRAKTGSPAPVLAGLAFVAVALVMAALGLADAAAAQADRSARPQPAFSEPETREAVRDLLSELDDSQARALLLERLTKEVDRRAAARADLETRGLGEIVRDHGQALGRHIADAADRLPRIAGGVAAAWSNFVAERGDRSLAWFFLALAACLAVGGAGAFAGHVAAVRLQSAIAAPSEAEGFAGELKVAALSALVRVLPVAAFVAGAGVTNLLASGTYPTDYDVIGRIISAVAWTGLAVAVARFALSPTLPEWGRCPVASEASHFLVWRIGLAAALFNFGVGLIQWLDQFGSPVTETRIGFWINLAVHALLLATVWQARGGIRAIVAGSAQIAESDRATWSRWWPWLMILLFIGHWLLVNILAATNNFSENLFTAMAATLAVVAGLPIIDHAARAAVGGLMPISPNTSRALQAADLTTRAGLVRVARVGVAIALALGLSWLWGLDLVSLAHKGIGERFAGSLLNLVLIAGIAYGLWELVRIVTERQIAIERSALGLDQHEGSEPMAEGEGGGAGARLGTILPLVRVALQITIAILAGLAILGELGINVLPIVAGAGVVGLAIGFGAQTLVKDILSGIFFLIDDAFRKGEYIDIGAVKGTVEKISLRSMQLRHHNGPLNTIPFGDIRHVTNFSRDWVIMKLSLRLTYDTDAEKVRKLIKKLGQEMAEEPNLKPLFLQPLKSQGVIEMQDSAQIMRVKFMTRPGDQWGLRRVVFARIRELFEKEGIRFASREVVVRVEHAQGAHELTEDERAAIGASAARALELADAAEGDRRKPG